VKKKRTEELFIFLKPKPLWNSKSEREELIRFQENYLEMSLKHLTLMIINMKRSKSNEGESITKSRYFQTSPIQNSRSRNLLGGRLLSKRREEMFKWDHTLERRSKKLECCLIKLMLNDVPDSQNFTRLKDLKRKKINCR